MEPTLPLPALLAEITAAFANEPYPGDEDLVADTTGSNAESLAVRNAFRGLRWQAVPDHVLAATPTGLSAMSVAGFHHYLPAFMCAVLRNSEADNTPGELVQLLKLPLEVSGIMVAEQIQRFKAIDSIQVADLEVVLQQQLAQTNRAINYFIARAGQFTKEQGRAVYRFLVYVQDRKDDELLKAQAELAVQRYWFQFK